MSYLRVRVVHFLRREIPAHGTQQIPATAIGKDDTEKMVCTAPSGKGFQFSLRGLLGVAASSVDGVELNILSLNFGVSSSGIKLPIVGRIGPPRIAAVIAVEVLARPSPEPGDIRN